MHAGLTRHKTHARFGRELGRWMHEPERFPALEMEENAAAQVTNSMVDVAAESRHA